MTTKYATIWQRRAPTAAASRSRLRLQTPTRPKPGTPLGCTWGRICNPSRNPAAAGCPEGFCQRELVVLSARASGQDELVRARSPASADRPRKGRGSSGRRTPRGALWPDHWGDWPRPGAGTRALCAILVIQSGTIPGGDLALPSGKPFSCSRVRRARPGDDVQAITGPFFPGVSFAQVIKRERGSGGQLSLQGGRWPAALCDAGRGRWRTTMPLRPTAVGVFSKESAEEGQLFFYS